MTDSSDQSVEYSDWEFLHEILKNTLRSIEPKQNVVHPIKRKVAEIHLRPRLLLDRIRRRRAVRHIRRRRHQDVSLLLNNIGILLLAVVRRSRRQSPSCVSLLCESRAVAAAAAATCCVWQVLLGGARVARGDSVHARFPRDRARSAVATTTITASVVGVWLLHVDVHGLHQRLDHDTRFAHSGVRLRVQIQNCQTYRQGFVRGGVRRAGAREAHVDCRCDVSGVRDQVWGLADAEGDVVEPDELDDVGGFGGADFDAGVGGLRGSDAGVAV